MTWFKNNIVILVLVATFAILSFLSLGTHALLNWDEAIYAQVAKESSTHPLDLTYFGNPWHEKPPLVIWLVQISTAFFGQNEFGLRFFIPVFSTLTLLFTYLATKERFKDEFKAIFVAVSFFVCYQFILNSFFLNLDIPATFFFALSFYAYEKSKENKKYWLLFWASIALGILTKSIIGLIPLTLPFFDFLTAKNFKEVKDTYFLNGLTLGLLIVAPWHLIQTLYYGSEFWKDYFIYHVVTRATEGIEGNGAGLIYYLDVFLQSEIFALLTVISILYFIYKSFKDRNYAGIILSFISVLILFSLASTKGYSYVTLLYPIITCMFGVTVASIVEATNKFKIQPLASVAIILVFIYTALSYNSYKVFKWTTEPAYLDNKKIAEFLKKEGLPAYSTDQSFAGPATWYYYGSQINIKNEKLAQAPKLVFHTQSKNIYNTGNYLLITQ